MIDHDLSCRLEIDSYSIEDINTKVSELQRLFSLKVPVGSLGKCEMLRGPICLDLACKLLKICIKRSRIFQCFGIATMSKDYSRIINLAGSVLNVAVESSSALDTLCIAFGPLYRQKSEEILFKLFGSDVHKISNSFQAAAFYYVAHSKTVSPFFLILILILI